MKKAIPRIELGTTSITPTEITVGEMLAIAQLPKENLEQQLTVFLQAILKDKDLPYQLTLQERYYCLLSYLKHLPNDLTDDVIIDEYFLKNSEKEWRLSIEEDEIQVRQLNGLELEALEQFAGNDLSKWALGAIALQITNKDFPYIPNQNHLNTCKNIIQNRYTQLVNLSSSDLNDIEEKYTRLNSELAYFLNCAYDALGVVLLLKEGTRFVPARFQCDATATGFVKRLFSALAFRSTTLTTQCEDEFS